MAPFFLPPTAATITGGVIDGQYRRSVRGCARRSDVVAAFVTPEGQARWNPDVQGGECVSGTVGAAGSELLLRYRMGMWARIRIERVDPNRIEYAIVDGGGGLPLRRARIAVDLTGGDETVEAITFRMEYALAGAYRLAGRVVRRAIESNLDASLPRLLEPPGHTAR